MNGNKEKEVILKVKDLSKTFSNESVQQHVLKNLELSIYKGDFTVIMGNSGSGKSTLLYALSGMDRPSLGIVLGVIKLYICGETEKMRHPEIKRKKLLTAAPELPLRFQNTQTISWRSSAETIADLYFSRIT